MAFKLNQNPTFRTTAEILEPTDNGPVKHTIGVRFAVMAKEDESLALEDFLRRAVLDVTDVVDDQDKPVSFSAALRDKLIEVPFVRAGLNRAYWTALSGAKAGN